MTSRADNYEKAIAIVDGKIKSGQLPETSRETFINKFFELLDSDTKSKKGPPVGTVQKCIQCGVSKKGHQCPKRKIAEVASHEQQGAPKRPKVDLGEILAKAINHENPAQALSNSLPKSNTLAGQLNEQFLKETKGDSQVARMQASYKRLTSQVPPEAPNSAQDGLNTSAVNSIAPGNTYGAPQYLPPYPYPHPQTYSFWPQPPPQYPYWCSLGQGSMPMQAPWGNWSLFPPYPHPSPSPAPHPTLAPRPVEQPSLQPTSQLQGNQSGLLSTAPPTSQVINDVVSRYTSTLNNAQSNSAPSTKSRPGTLRDIMIRPNPISLYNSENFIKNPADLLATSTDTQRLKEQDPTSPETASDDSSRVLTLNYSSGQITTVNIAADEEFDPDQIAELFRDPDYDYELLVGLPNEPTPVRDINKLPILIDDNDATATRIDCSICRENVLSSRVELRELPCKHIFCANCIDNWFATNHNCPNCRSIVE